jgi:inorganic triphosphatase YgiF
VEGASSEPVEIEWQLDAPDLERVVQWLEGAPPSRITVRSASTNDHVDTYLDTEDRRLGAAGYSVRIRRGDDGSAETTLKTLDRAEENEPRIRRELEEPLERDEASLVVRAPGPVGEAVRAVAGSRELVPLFAAETHRRVFPLELDGDGAGELSLDDTTFRDPSGSVLTSLVRVEVEVPQSAVDAARELVEAARTACGLTSAALSKYEVGLAAVEATRASSGWDDDAAVPNGDREANPSRKDD